MTFGIPHNTEQKLLELTIAIKIIQVYLVLICADYLQYHNWENNMSTINTNHTPSMWDKYMPKKLTAQEVEELKEYMAQKAIERQEKLERNELPHLTFQDFMLGRITPKLDLYLGDDPEAYKSWRASQKGYVDIDSLFSGYKDKEIWNAKGLSNTINTPYGEMRVSLKMDGFYYDVENLSELSYLDSYNDGFISKNDYLADKLVLRGYDANGDEIELNFLDVMGVFDLTGLYNDKKYSLNRGKNHVDKILETLGQHGSSMSTAEQNRMLSENGNSSYRAEVSYQKHDTKNTIAFFESYADKNGWIDFKNDDVARRIFDSQSLQLAYRKVGADGALRLEKISFATNYNKNLDIFNAEVSDDKTGINVKMQQYMVGVRVDRDFDRRALFAAVVNQEPINNYWIGPSPILNAQAFSDVTGLAYTEANVQRVKEGLENGGEEFLNSLADIEAVTAMHLDKDAGKITLRFSSGRETTIAIEDLYSDSGEFVVDENGERAMQMSGAAEMSQEELNDLDFEKVGAIFDDSGKVASLKSWGIMAIQKATYGDGRFLSFVLTNAEGKSFNVRELYNLSYLSGGWLEGKHEKQAESQSDSALKTAPKPIVSPNKPIDMRV